MDSPELKVTDGADMGLYFGVNKFMGHHIMFAAKPLFAGGTEVLLIGIGRRGG